MNLAVVLYAIALVSPGFKERAQDKVPVFSVDAEMLHFATHGLPAPAPVGFVGWVKSNFEFEDRHLPPTMRQPRWTKSTEAVKQTRFGRIQIYGESVQRSRRGLWGPVTQDTGVVEWTFK